jgi:hypothetical protein
LITGSLMVEKVAVTVSEYNAHDNLPPVDYLGTKVKQRGYTLLSAL